MQVLSRRTQLKRAKLSMYETAPQGDVSLDFFCSIALKRLHVLRQIDWQNSKGKAWGDTVNTGLSEFRKFAPSMISQSTDAAESDLKSDVVSHFVLRLAFCQTEELRKWFIAQETLLFRMRFEALADDDAAAFLRHNNLHFDTLSEAEWAQFNLPLSELQMAQQNQGQAHSRTRYFKVPFGKVPTLVRKRQVLLVGGMAFVHHRDLAKVVLGHFRASLSKSLTTASRMLPTILAQEKDRLAPFLVSVGRSYMVSEGSSASYTPGSGDRVNLSNIWAMSEKHFPPCMQRLMRTLKDEHHLKHAGRMQLGLFLKGAGMTMEESLEFWKDQFAPKTPGDKFHKEYAYNIRHNYGKEGKRVNYSPYGCMKIIQSHAHAGEPHGCPFKTLESSQLDSVLSRMGGWKLNAKAEVVSLAKSGHFQIACQKTFEAAHPDHPEAANVQVTHPNGYLKQSLELAMGHGLGGQRQAGAAAKDEDVDMGVTPEMFDELLAQAGAAGQPVASAQGGRKAAELEAQDMAMADEEFARAN